MGRVYSYLRFSDPKQAAGGSIDRQQAYAARWAAEHGMALDESLSLRDEGLSAYHQRHVKSGALGAFLQAVHQGQVQPGSVLVVEGLDRLSRAEPLQAQSQLAAIVNADISVVTASDGRVYSRESLKANPMDLIYSLLVMIRAHEESDTKSRRVSAALVRLAEQWQAGTYRGRIHIGRDPAWLTWTGQAWKVDEAAAAAVRELCRLFALGLGPAAIRQRLVAQGLRAADDHHHLQAHRIVRNPMLVGTKTFRAGGRDWALEGYYPPLLTPAEWDALQVATTGRARSKVASTYTELLTGFELTRCGYCGSTMLAQNMRSRLKPGESTLPDAYRRLRCTRRSSASVRGTPCPIGGSCALRPVEAAIIDYCSEMINMRTLITTGRADAVRDALAKARQAQRLAEAQRDRLVDAMLASDKPPQAWVERTQAVEAQLAELKASVAQLEAELAVSARASDSTAHEQFAALSAGVAAMDDNARLQARQLIADSFAQVVVWARGITPPTANADRAWKLRRDQNREHTDILLVAKSGARRMLRIDQHGQWTAADHVDVPG